MAEGANELGSTQYIVSGTTLYVDILDPANETIEWTGNGGVRVFTEDGSQQVTTLNLCPTFLGLVCTQPRTPRTYSMATHPAGTYRIEIESDQDDDWNFNVFETNNTNSVKLGRLFAYNWDFNVGNFTDDTDASFYAITDGGAPGHDAVVELKLLLHYIVRGADAFEAPTQRDDDQDPDRPLAFAY